MGTRTKRNPASEGDGAGLKRAVAAMMGMGARDRQRLSSKAKTAATAVDRACANEISPRAYRCGTALDFDQLPQLSPARGADAVQYLIYLCGNDGG